VNETGSCVFDEFERFLKENYGAETPWKSYIESRIRLLKKLEEPDSNGTGTA
jgi:hypothetical protein